MGAYRPSNSLSIRFWCVKRDDQASRHALVESMICRNAEELLSVQDTEGYQQITPRREVHAKAWWLGKEKNNTYRNTYSSQDFVCFFKILEENCHLAVIGRPFHESAKLPLHGLHGVPIESPSVEGGGMGRKGEMRRLGQTGGEFGIRMERRSLAKREGDSGTKKRDRKGVSRQERERESEQASKQASERE